jgi:hypothetical protein
MIKRFFLVTSFLVFFFLAPSAIFAQTVTSTTTATSSTTTTTSQPSWWDQFWNWVFGLFVKTDYTINTRPLDSVNSDMTDYGDTNQDDYKNKHSFAGSRVTDSSSQICLKGNVIKQVLLGTSGYSDADLSQICLDSSKKCFVQAFTDSPQDSTGCDKITIKDLAHYFIQLQKNFYCSDTGNILINTDQTIINKTNQTFSTAIPSNEIDCYPQIYDDFYLTPKDSSDTNEANTKKMMQTPISDGNQNSNNDSNQIKGQINQNFSPDGTTTGLSGLRPDSWGK